MTSDLTDVLLEQLTLHWDVHVRPHLEGLSDEEYLWEPVPGCWSLRPGEGGRWQADFVHPEPDPAPVTTIAWRLGHVIVGIFGERNASHFGGPPMSYDRFDWAPDARTALAQLDDGYARWVEGVRSLGDARLWDPVGPAEGEFGHLPYATLVLHIHREAIHHLGEVLLLRDLHRASRVAGVAARIDGLTDDDIRTTRLATAVAETDPDGTDGGDADGTDGGDADPDGTDGGDADGGDA